MAKTLDRRSANLGLQKMDLTNYVPDSPLKFNPQPHEEVRLSRITEEGK